MQHVRVSLNINKQTGVGFVFILLLPLFEMTRQMFLLLLIPYLGPTFTFGWQQHREMKQTENVCVLHFFCLKII